MVRLGIDLGTTFSVVSYYDGHRVEVIPDPETSGQLIVPSAVYYPEDGAPIVGWTALNKAAEDPNRLVQWVKMSMGTDFKKKIGDKEYTPEQVSAEILKKLKQNAEVYLGEDVEEVVVTVPAYFGDAQRNATMKAAEIAGLNVVRLLAEPSAAALAYVVEANTDLSGDRYVLVSDIGGGTYDVTLLQTQPMEDAEGNPTLNIRIVCKDGSQELGGKLWDDALEDYVVKQCIDQGHTDDPRAEPRLALSLRDRVIQGKHMLSTSDSTQIICDAGNTQEVTNEKFEELTAALVLQAESKLRSVLAQAEEQPGELLFSTGLEIQGDLDSASIPESLQQEFENHGISLSQDATVSIKVESKRWLISDEDNKYPVVKDGEDKLNVHRGISLEDIDPILQVGGSTKMPMVARMIENVTGKQPQTHRNVDLLVAIGAAYDVCIASDMVDDEPIKTRSGELVTTPPIDIGKAVGVKAFDPSGKDFNVIVIPDGSALGEEFVRDNLATRYDNQGAIKFEIYEGNSEVLSECVLLATFTLPLPPNQPEHTRVEVTLKYNESGIIEGSAVCFTSEGPKEVPIEIDRTKIAKG